MKLDKLEHNIFCSEKTNFSSSCLEKVGLCIWSQENHHTLSEVQKWRIMIWGFKCRHRKHKRSDLPGHNREEFNLISWENESGETKDVLTKQNNVPNRAAEITQEGFAWPSQWFQSPGWRLQKFMEDSEIMRTLIILGNWRWFAKKSGSKLNCNAAKS